MHQLEVLEKFHFVCEGNYKKEKKSYSHPIQKKVNMHQKQPNKREKKNLNETIMKL